MDKKEEIKLLAEQDLETFIKLVHPRTILGSVHSELIRWWNREDAKNHQITLLPRDHQKSRMIAYRVAHEITKNPAVRVIYMSSTSTLAVKQVKFIKDILTSPQYKYYWPEMVNTDEAKRDKWSETEFNVDHPKRKEENIRDSTVFAAGLTTSITGLHCDIAVLDDIVVKENAYTEEGRDKVRSQFSLFASIEAADAREWIVGTRYHPADLYNDIMQTNVETFNEEGEIVDSYPLYEVFERKVEDSLTGNGTGQFLWPRTQTSDGRWFGFNVEVLAIKKAQYIDRTQFRAQYYNDPNDIENAVISRDQFQYYDPKHLTRYDGRWFYKNERLNLIASIDFAFSLQKRSDFTSIVVIGVTGENIYYILEIDRFKTNKISDYFSHILKLHQKWDFRRLRAEITSGQAVIVKDLKDNYIRPYGLSIVVDEFKPDRRMGSKEERVEAILQPKYNNNQIMHYRGGNCQILEEELILKHPAHDDVKDALASAIDAAIPPSGALMFSRRRQSELIGKLTNSRFGGLAG